MKPTAKIIVISALLAFCGTSLANELLVPTQYPAIQSAIDAAVDGDTVIVAPGTYTGSGNRDIDFLGKAITVRSTDPNDPNIVTATIIDCNGTETEFHRGFYFHNGEDSNSVLDGFTITNGVTLPSRGTDSGGGIACSGSSPTISNCRITDNVAYSKGGGIYCYDSNATITGCTVTGNSARYGGGLFACNGSITNCTIIGNSADYSGGGLARCDGPVTNCIITGNSASEGGGLFDCDGSITNCTIKGNSNSGLNRCSGPITNCIVTGNTTSGSGGGLCDCDGPVSGCIITDNTARCDGGGLLSCDGPITSCIINGNSATGLYNGGGGLCVCMGPIMNCTITGNKCQLEGGGLAHCHGGPISNCIIVNNTSGLDGGGMYNCRGLINNCTISGNTADRWGGGVFSYAYATITNCILWSNRATSGPEIALHRVRYSKPSTLKISYSDIQGGEAQVYILSNTLIWDSGNIDTDPCFVQPGYWADANEPNIIVESNDPNAVWVDGDYHLLPTSPCINTGDPNYVPEPNETDLDGLPRIIGGRIDMGAYEFNHQPVADAGPNQTVYAWINGFADVNLDASASFDDDNDVLDYYWSWTIDGNTYEANGINPTIKLPVGTHTIELVVDDGIDLSQPDYCTITVIKAVRGKLTLSPRVLETKSCGKWILATLFIPSVPGEKVNTNEPLRLYPGGVEAKYQRFSKLGKFGCAPTFALAYFDKQQVIDALGPGQFDVSVVGRFLTGRFFFGSDTIKIIAPKPPRPKPPYYWH
jgi:parallel beta-helix repeat protein